tara:strand:- start:393 stop:791 length:399 start_codon:yes stop_codon:yes gene_type:complete
MSTISNTDLTITDANVTNIKDGSGNNATTPADLVKGRAKYWCYFKGNGTAAVQDSFNNAGFSDTGTGTYTLTIDTDFASATYIALATVCNSSRANVSLDSLAAGSLNVNTRETDSGTFTDYEFTSVAAFGDQ